jgi:glutathione S-transferase
LNFKRVQYKTEWVDLPDVASVRKRLGVAPNRTFFDGTPFYTLPIIQDLSTGAIVGDSFDNALYLDRTYTEATHTPSLFPPSTIALQRAWNKQIDDIFAPFISLCVEGIPLNPETAEITKASFVFRSQKEKWEDFHLSADERAKQLAQSKETLGGLAAFYRDVESPFLGGENPIYADLIVGAWLAFCRIALPAKEWEEVQTWQDGMWGKLDRALNKYAEIK